MLPQGMGAWDESERRAQHGETCVAGMRQWQIADGLSGAWWQLTVPEPSAPMYVSLPVDEVAHIAMLDETMHFPAFVPSGDDDPVHIPAFSPALDEEYPRVSWPPAEREQRGDSRSPVGPNEDCTEEERQRRSAKRVAGVAAVKRSTDYYVVAIANPSVPRPSTPDPTDKKVSKRSWERSMQEWRWDLKGVVANLPTP